MKLLKRLAQLGSTGYDQLLRHAPATLTAVVLVVLAATFFARDLVFEASARTLVTPNDDAYAFYVEISERFATRPFILVTVELAQPLFSQPGLAALARLQETIAGFSGVASTTSILDVPLIVPGSVDLDNMDTNPPTLRGALIDLGAAKKALDVNPLVTNNLLSASGDIAAIRADLTAATADDADKTKTLVAALRRLVDNPPPGARLHVGGVPVIATDMVSYVTQDVTAFGVAVIFLLAITLWLFFRRWRWVLLPVACGLASVAVTAGWLALVDRPVTVVSANFVPLVFILAVSLVIHIAVRYRELIRQTPRAQVAARRDRLVRDAMHSKLAPCFYTALTTCIAFGSLVTSNIQPIVDFGWMVSMGTATAFVVSYLVVGPVLVLLPAEPLHGAPGTGVTRFLSRVVQRHAAWIVAVGVLAAAFTAGGLGRIGLENRFIDYFRQGTDIRRSLTFLDEHFGGTLPFEIVVSVAPHVPLDEDDPFFVGETDADSEVYWFTPALLTQLEQLDAAVARYPQVGSTTSIAALWQLAKTLNGGPLAAPELTYVLRAIPTGLRGELLAPYAHPATGSLRISGRMRQTGRLDDHDKFRGAVVEAAAAAGFDPVGVHVTGMMVLFDNMLRQLFDSQKSTLAFVIAATLALFALLLRSLTLAVIGLMPNVLGAGFVLALMGYLSIPMDIMTVAIAAICVGMGVDDAIHYLHRFKREAATADTATAIRSTHVSVGRAMYLTSTAVIVGFSVLALSPFLPTVRFGLLTGFAMAVVLIANLLVVPGLLMLFGRWFGGRRAPAAETQTGDLGTG